MTQGAWTSVGLIGAGNCFGGVGHVGDGGPKAVSWADPSGAQHLEAYVVSAEGDLFHWRKNEWMESLSSYRYEVYADSNTTVPVCPNDPSVSGIDLPVVTRSVPFVGTPEIVTYTSGTTPVRQVFLRSATGALWRYRSIGLPSATTDGRPASIWTTTRYAAGPDWAQPFGIGPFDTQTPPFCDQDEKHPTFGTDFVALPQLMDGFITLLTTDNHNNIAVAHVGVASTGDAAGPAWEWEALPINPDSQLNLSPAIVATPGAIKSVNGVDGILIYAIRADGALDEASDQKGLKGWHNCGGQIDDTHNSPSINPYALCPLHDWGVCALGVGSVFSWHGGAGPVTATNHDPTARPFIVPSRDGGQYGYQCKKGGDLMSLFPQWARVYPLNGVGGTGQPGPDLLYPWDTDFYGGYEAEVTEQVEGVVVGSHISAMDMPGNHTIGEAGEWPRVHHDWNIIVAPDLKYQHLLTDANILGGGTMEMEWEVGDHLIDGQHRVVGTKGFTTDAVPAVGDRIAVRGRYMFDCGHPPYHTEIHPIDAMAIVHGKTVKLRFSTAGGKAWFQPNDTNLIDTNQPDRLCSLEESLGDAVENLTEGSWLDVVNRVWNVGCAQTKDLSLLSPVAQCYGEYVPQIASIDSRWPSKPLSFDVPGTLAVASFSPTSVAYSQSPSAANPGSTTVTMTAADIASAMPPLASSPSTGDHRYTPRFDAKVSSLTTGFTQVGYAPRVVDVCFVRTALIGHDARGALCFLGGDDYSDEKITYVSANGQTKLYSPADNNCLTVGVEAGEKLHLGAHGFECDFSCGELWDEESIGLANDRVGTIDLAIPLGQDVRLPITITALSQANNDSKRSRLITGGDYKMAITISDR